MGNYNIHIDLPRAKKVEKIVAEELKNLNSAIDKIEHAPDEKFSDWDLNCTIKDKSEKIEIKEDQMVSKTGNLFIEIESRGKPSGILTSKADFYIFVAILKDTVDLFKIPLKELKNMLSKGRLVGNAGDKNSNTCRVYHKTPAF